MPTTGKPRTKSNRIAPLIKTDFSDIISEIEKEEKALRDIENPYSQEHIYKVFVKWKESSKSNSFKAAIDYSKVTVHPDNKITIRTPAEIYIDMLKQEMAMIEEIHMMYPSKELTFEFIVDKSAFPQYVPPKKVKLLSAAEKYDKLKRKNPHFELLVNELKLKPI